MCSVLCWMMYLIHTRPGLGGSAVSPLRPGRSMDRTVVSGTRDGGSIPSRAVLLTLGSVGGFIGLFGRAAGGARWKIYHQVLLRGRLALEVCAGGARGVDGQSALPGSSPGRGFVLCPWECWWGDTQKTR